MNIHYIKMKAFNCCSFPFHASIPSVCRWYLRDRVAWRCQMWSLSWLKWSLSQLKWSLSWLKWSLSQLKWMTLSLVSMMPVVGTAMVTAMIMTAGSGTGVIGTGTRNLRGAPPHGGASGLLGRLGLLCMKSRKAGLGSSQVGKRKMMMIIGVIGNQPMWRKWWRRRNRRRWVWRWSKCQVTTTTFQRHSGPTPSLQNCRRTKDFGNGTNGPKTIQWVMKVLKNAFHWRFSAPGSSKTGSPKSPKSAKTRSFFVVGVVGVVIEGANEWLLPTLSANSQKWRFWIVLVCLGFVWFLLVTNGFQWFLMVSACFCMFLLSDLMYQRSEHERAVKVARLLENVWERLVTGAVAGCCCRWGFVGIGVLVQSSSACYLMSF